jgi:hypothetical protein
MWGKIREKGVELEPGIYKCVIYGNTMTHRNGFSHANAKDIITHMREKRGKGE